MRGCWFAIYLDMHQLLLKQARSGSAHHLVIGVAAVLWLVEVRFYIFQVICRLPYRDTQLSHKAPIRWSMSFYLPFLAYGRFFMCFLSRWADISQWSIFDSLDDFWLRIDRLWLQELVLHLSLFYLVGCRIDNVICGVLLDEVFDLGIELDQVLQGIILTGEDACIVFIDRWLACSHLYTAFLGTWLPFHVVDRLIWLLPSCVHSRSSLVNDVLNRSLFDSR